MNRLTTRLNAQALETRELQATALAASLDAAGILSVIGSTGDDKIQVRFTGGAVQVFDAVANQTVGIRVATTGQTVQSVLRTAINNADPNCGIRIACNAGNDAVWVGTANVWVGEEAGNPALRLNVDGGIGYDSLTGGSANDILNGGTEDDSITGGGGNDTLQGGTGTDTLCEDVTGWAVLTNNKFQVGDLNIGGPKTVPATDVTANFEKARLRFTNVNATADASGFSGSETLVGPTGYDIALPKGQAMPVHFWNLGPDILARYQALGGPTGVLGLPVGDAFAVAPRGVPGRVVTFEHGMICQLNGGPAVAITGAFYKKWIGMGGLTKYYGVPTSEVYTTANGVQVVDFQYGKMYYQNKLSGVCMVEGAILDKYLALGGPGGVLGIPTSDEFSPDSRGRATHFLHGDIFWTSQLGAHEVHGDIRGRYAAMGGVQSPLGYPTSDEVDAPGGGRASYFQNGVIYWTPTTGAHELWGQYYAKFQRYGGLATFGYPTSDIYYVPYYFGGYGFTVDFQRGIIQTNSNFPGTWDVAKKLDAAPYWYFFEKLTR